MDKKGGQFREEDKNCPSYHEQFNFSNVHTKVRADNIFLSK
jgi:hypothetical protein